MFLFVTIRVIRGYKLKDLPVLIDSTILNVTSAVLMISSNGMIAEPPLKRNQESFYRKVL